MYLFIIYVVHVYTYVYTCIYIHSLIWDVFD